MSKKRRGKRYKTTGTYDANFRRIFESMKAHQVRNMLQSRKRKQK